ncbi:MAG: septum formation initiator family protein [Acidobacteriota bacterium]|nr:septum formation initiator family protein [Acidobacteriota bacterium]
MAETTTPNRDRRTAAPAAGGSADEAASAGRQRRKNDALPRAQAAARRTKIVQVAILAVAAVITIDALVGEKGLLQTFRAKREHARLVGSINTLRHDNARLRDHARRLREDPATIEEVARRELGLVKPGEILVIVRDAQKR